ncbi:MAG: hypothetical protein ABI401_10545 [Candidatus Dormibacter sp.]
MSAPIDCETEQFMALGNMRERIELAKVRCLSLAELLDEVEGAPLLAYHEKTVYLFRLTEDQARRRFHKKDRSPN